ncbi:MAG: hypothetical protein RLZZ444_2237 [Pseudomonadota bacterium]
MTSRPTSSILAICLSMTAISAVAGPLQGVQAIATGPKHACATTANGQVQCWGDNTTFALGDGHRYVDPFAKRATPAPVRTLRSVTAIANGEHHSCAIENGGIRCWGGNPFNAANVIGDGSAPNSIGQINPTPPIATELLSNVIAVNSNYHHTCAIRHVSNVDSAWCWGYNASGQLGYGARDLSHDPMPVSILPSPIAGIATGSEFTCAVAGGGAWCWGDNSLGQLGIGTTPGTHFTPEPVAGLASGVSAIAAAKDHACAIVSGNVMCWGKNNSSGVLGDGSTNDSKTPVAVVGLPAGVTAIAMGTSHTCALANGGVKCWGDGGSGKLGIPGIGSSRTPVDVTDLTSGVTAIAAPGIGNYTCAILQDQTGRCWGSNDSRQLGNGDDSGAPSYVPTTVVEADFIFYDSFGMTAD